MSNSPLVSILVPTYNGSKYIRRFLDSALDQELSDFEIVFVDDMSTDDTLDVLEQYRKVFPDKICIFPSDVHHGSIGAMRNLAFSHARGKYVYWCDQDDILHPCGLKNLVDAAEEHDCEIVCGWAYITQVGDDGIATTLTVHNKKQTQAASIEASIINGIDYWVRLIRKDFAEQHDPIPENCFFDDVAYMPCLQSYAKSIRFVNYPIYYYHRRKDSASGSVRREVCEGSVKAEKYALEHCNPDYLEAVQYFVATRTEMNLNMRWQYFDVFVNWAKEQMAWIPDNHLITRNRKLFDRIKWAASLTENLIPNRVYVSGFGAAPKQERLDELREKVFYDGCDVVVLSEENCDINSNEYVKRAYENGDFEFVAGYFAVKNIFENGGVYIHDRIRILNYFTYYKYQHAIIFRLDNTTFSDCIFGAPAGNPVFSDILETYCDHWDKKQTYSPLAQRIKVILTAKYDIPLNNSGKGFSYPVSVISPNNGLVNIDFGKQICEHDFSDRYADEEYVTIKRSEILALCDIRAMSGGRRFPGNQARGSAAERELSEIKNSNTWKIVMKLRKLGDSPIGPFLKKIFYGMLKIRKKFKKKK